MLNLLLSFVRKTLLLLCIAISSNLFATECNEPKSTLKVSLSNAFPTLPSIASPIAMTQPKKYSSFWFMLTREGEILSFENKESSKSFSKVLDIRNKVDIRLEMGLTGATFHPNYPQDNRLFFVYNDKTRKGRSTLSSIEINPKTLKAEIKTEKVLLTLPQQQPNHNGGNLSFGPDNMLYVGFGDGGYDMASSQSLNNLYGSILRIDVNTSPYAIPKDNPFNKGQDKCDAGTSSQKCPEVFAYGLRNPWRFSFDKQTGELWVADVGEDTYEEINRVEAGKNYGWPSMEGDICFDNKPCKKENLALPVTQYDYEGPQSIVGGYVYRGEKFPALKGHYIFTDTFGTILYSVKADAKSVTKPNTLLTTGRKSVSFAEGNDGEIYLLNFEAERGDVVHLLTGSCH